MSKRAEDAGLTAYPFFPGPQIDPRDENPTDYNKIHRRLFIEGYEQAEKDLGWHSVDECLPPYDEEVIVLSDKITGNIRFSCNCICYGHRPNPDGWDGKNLSTGIVSHYDVKTYNGWNIPGVHHWMYCPKLPEE